MAWDRAQVDITDPAAVESALAQYDAEVVFNAAAYNQVDVAEKEPQAAFLVNALAVRNLALACRQVDAQLVHFSTDYVFDGAARHPYVEEDPTASVGRLCGLQTGRRTLRASLSGSRAGGANLGRVRPGRTDHGARQFRGADAAPGRFANPIRVVEDHVASPTFAPLLASRTIDLVERKISGRLSHRRRSTRFPGFNLRG